MKPIPLEYASPPAPTRYARWVLPVLVFAATSFACGLACDYACDAFGPKIDVMRGYATFIYGQQWVADVLIARILLFVYTVSIMGKKAFDLASEQRYVIPNACLVAIGGGAAFGAFTEVFHLFISNAAFMTLLLATLMIPAAFPFAFLRRRST